MACDVPKIKRDRRIFSNALRFSSPSQRVPSTYPLEAIDVGATIGSCCAC